MVRSLTLFIAAPEACGAGGAGRRGEEQKGKAGGAAMSVRIKAVVDRFVKELQEALDADIQDRVMKEREMQSYIEEREREVAEREAAWKAELSRREVIVAVSFLFLFLFTSVCPGVETISARCSCLRAVLAVDELADVTQCRHIFRFVEIYAPRCKPELSVRGSEFSYI